MAPTNHGISDEEDSKVIPAKGKAPIRKKRRNKPKDYPKRPLSAYNVFFKETREEILAAKEKNGEKRDHKLDFQTMAKEIASRWKSLDKHERERVDKLAKKDMLRYRDEVKAYEEEMVKKNREQREEAAAKTAAKKEEEVAAAAASAEKARLADRLEKEEAIRSSAAANAMAGGVGSSSLETLSALAGRYPPAGGAGANEASLQEALFLHQQREMIQRQLLLEELRAVEERELQLRRLQSLGLLQDSGFGGLQAHQLGGLFGGGGGQNHAASMLLQDHSGRGGVGGGLQGYLGGGHPLFGGAGSGLPHELLYGASGAGGGLHQQESYLLQQQQQQQLQDHYARLLGGHGKEAGAP